MKIHLIQITVKENDTESNLKKACSMILKLRGEGGIAVLPEMFIPGYNKKNIRYWGERWQYAVMCIADAAKRAKISVVFTTPVSERDKRYNRALFLDKDGTIISKYDKVHLFRLMEEEKIFSEGNKLETFKFGEWTAGINTCYDIRFPESQRKLWKEGADLMIVPATWPHKRVDAMVKLAYARAVENQCYFVIVNRASEDPDKPTYGGNSMVIAPDGSLVCGCGILEESASGEIEISKVEEYRKLIDCKADRRQELY